MENIDPRFDACFYLPKVLETKCGYVEEKDGIAVVGPSRLATLSPTLVRDNLQHGTLQLKF
jgi:hypothetical protein